MYNSPQVNRILFLVHVKTKISVPERQRVFSKQCLKHQVPSVLGSTIFIQHSIPKVDIFALS